MSLSTSFCVGGIDPINVLITLLRILTSLPTMWLQLVTENTSTAVCRLPPPFAYYLPSRSPKPTACLHCINKTFPSIYIPFYTKKPVITGQLGSMAQQRHLVSGVAALPYYYATPPEEEAFLTSHDYFSYPEWFRSNNIIGQPIDNTNSARTKWDYTPATWEPQNDDGSFQQQQYPQPPQSTILGSPVDWPSPAFSTTAMVTAWRLSFGNQHQIESGLNHIATKKTRKVSKAIQPIADVF
ncbi:hypothetical protein LZ30DRAFT_288788 [Colletotrichum cereale]|nr:hypothetical protein LZ30DRAFT_288788 [Colletotrichum cereale]